MKRLFAAAALFVAMAVLCAVFLMMLGRSRAEFIGRLEEIGECAWREDMTATEKRIAELNDDWRKEEHKLSHFVIAERLDELTAVFSRLGPLFSFGDRAAFYAEIERGKAVLEHVWRSEQPIAANIF